MRTVQDWYNENIDIATRRDDARLSQDNIRLIIGNESRVLSPANALKLAAAILDTLSELPETQ